MYNMYSMQPCNDEIVAEDGSHSMTPKLLEAYRLTPCPRSTPVAGGSRLEIRLHPAPRKACLQRLTDADVPNGQGVGTLDLLLLVTSKRRESAIATLAIRRGLAADGGYS